VTPAEHFTAFDHACMAEALVLARRGLRSTMPNPRVGCVLARDGEVVGRGWHEHAGGPHAEVHALEDAGRRARGAAAYVTLEPCAHQGRTGPCADALIQAGVQAVVAAVRDPNPSVNGGGLARLAAAGVDTRVGLLEEQGRALNPGFLSRMERGRPWVRVKLAQSLDGRTALASGESQWITGAAAREDVQRWRSRACAILTGVGTVLVDDPSLNVRLPDAPRQPLRVIVDSRWRTPPNARTLSLPGDVLIVGLNSAPIPPALSAAAECLSLPAAADPIAGGALRVDLEALLDELARREINEVHVEAGGTLNGALLRATLLDELLVYQADLLLGDAGRPSFLLGVLGAMEERPQFRALERVAVGDDLRMRLAPPYREV
jgi:diaminohydroxyphosphoribosylaminopyrimidine deaminase/5-amino-6-(5-phosphoribosylamino)uracil reductase